jgi:hypothetical protein
MELGVLVALCGLAFSLSTLLWHVLVQPHVVVSLFQMDGLTDQDWEGREQEAGLRALRWSLGAAVVAVGFITGATLSFLAATSA